MNDAAERYAEHSGRIEHAPSASVDGALWAAFTAGIRASATPPEDGDLYAPESAHMLGQEIGWMLRGGVALDPSLAPILDRLTKES